MPILFFAFLSAMNPAKKENKLIKKALSKEFAYVPSGMAYVEDKIVSVQSFYMSKCEITNEQYGEFLKDLERKGDLEKLKIAEIDSMKWNMNSGLNIAFVNYYHVHIAYQDYPVVNISHEAASLYCEWLSEKYNHLHQTKGKFLFRLPERGEFVRAARGDSKDVNYAWGTNYIRNSEGQIQCNTLHFGEEGVHWNEEKKKYEFIPIEWNFPESADILAPSESYWANSFGFYNLNGNAAEMISEKGVAVGGSWKNPGYDVRIESQSEYTEANPMTGFRVVMTFIEG